MLTESGFLVVVLCAQWCGVCREFKSPLQDLARSLPMHRFVWVDIENPQAWEDEVDVENFPTVLVTDSHQRQYFLGPVEPYVNSLGRLIASLELMKPPQVALAQGLAQRVGRYERRLDGETVNFLDLG